MAILAPNQNAYPPLSDLKLDVFSKGRLGGSQARFWLDFEGSGEGFGEGFGRVWRGVWSLLAPLGPLFGVSF